MVRDGYYMGRSLLYRVRYGVVRLCTYVPIARWIESQQYPDVNSIARGIQERRLFKLRTMNEEEAIAIRDGRKQ